jgi:hypothetical protein
VSDTEVLLKTWVEWGEHCLQRLVGFAVHDRKEQTLTCVRDAFGIKPLFYSLCCPCLKNTSSQPKATPKSVFRGAIRGIVPDAILDGRDKITPEQEWFGTPRARLVSGWSTRMTCPTQGAAPESLRHDDGRGDAVLVAGLAMDQLHQRHTIFSMRSA